MRFRLLLLFALACLLPACQVPPEVHARVLAPDYSTPEAGGATFLAAFAVDDADAEYRCFGEGLKEVYGANLTIYLLGRPQLREEARSWAKHAWRLEPVRREQAEFGTWVGWGYQGREYVAFLMQPQYYFDVLLEDGQVKGNLLSQHPSEILDLDRKTLRLELTDAVLRGVAREDVVGVEVGVEWKIQQLESGTP